MSMLCGTCKNGGCGCDVSGVSILFYLIWDAGLFGSTVIVESE